MNNVNIPKRQYHHGNLREALITAGMRAVAEHGPAGFSLRDVAKRAGVTPPAVYRHFGDKDELLAAIAVECSERLAATVAESLASAEGNALTRFRYVGIAYVQFAVAHPEHFRAMTIPGVVQRLPEEQRQQMAVWHDQQRRDIDAAKARGEIANIPTNDILIAANALVHGLAHAIVEGQFGRVDAKRARELAVAATGVFGIGLVPR